MSEARPGGWALAGLFTVALATLMYETLLIRIFSVRFARAREPA